LKHERRSVEPELRAIPHDVMIHLDYAQVILCIQRRGDRVPRIGISWVKSMPGGWK